MGGDVACGLCGAAEETLEQFLVRCVALEEVRVKHGVVDVGEALGFGVLSWGEVGEYLVELWGVRGRETGGGAGDGG